MKYTEEELKQQVASAVGRIVSAFKGLSKAEKLRLDGEAMVNEANSDSARYVAEKQAAEDSLRAALRGLSEL